MAKTQERPKVSPSFFQILKRKVNTAKAVTEKYRALLTPWEFILMYVNYIIATLIHRDFSLHVHAMHKRRSKKYIARYVKNGLNIIKDVRLPLLDPENTIEFYACIFEDTFLVYTEYDDCYDEARIDHLMDSPTDGPYGLRNDLVGVTVEEGDIVIDAGSWIGDFAAYASVKGAVVYAFEPTDSTFEYLLKTAELNKNIYPVKKGLGDRKTSVSFHGKDYGSGNRIVSAPIDATDQVIETTSIDAFVEENGLKRVDFIKADIEGYERQMLKGAGETLRRFAPKLAICTYHLPDDPEVLAALIKEANPAYRIVQKSKKLYASVPKR
jgi:FkbM family methyltransferase